MMILFTIIIRQNENIRLKIKLFNKPTLRSMRKNIKHKNCIHIFRLKNIGILLPFLQIITNSRFYLTTKSLSKYMYGVFIFCAIILCT